MKVTPQLRWRTGRQNIVAWFPNLHVKRSNLLHHHGVEMDRISVDGAIGVYSLLTDEGHFPRSYSMIIAELKASSA